VTSHHPICGLFHFCAISLFTVKFPLANPDQKMHTFRDFALALYLERYARPANLKVTQFGSVGEFVIWIKEAFEIFG
jgi:hypothetical protein